MGLRRALAPFPQLGGILKETGPGASGERIVSPGAGELNRRFPISVESGQYFTFVYGIVDMVSLEFVYVRAGHPGPILVEGNTAFCLDGVGNIPVGIDEGAEFEEGRIELKSGQSVLFCTDGVDETMNLEDEMLGVSRVLEYLGGCGDGSIGDMVGSLEKHVDVFLGGLPQRDDITILGMRIG